MDPEATAMEGESCSRSNHSTVQTVLVVIIKAEISVWKFLTIK